MKVITAILILCYSWCVYSY